MTDEWTIRRERLLRVLQAQPGREFCASALKPLAEIEDKKYVRRALTVNYDQVTPLPGVQMQKYLKSDGSLKKASYWFSWIGQTVGDELQNSR